MSEDLKFSNLRFIDLGLVNEIGNANIGGTPIYMPISSLFDNKSDSKFDAFSLAMTIMVIETFYEPP